jgi:hypothetical protein
VSVVTPEFEVVLVLPVVLEIGSFRAVLEGLWP